MTVRATATLIGNRIHVKTSFSPAEFDEQRTRIKRCTSGVRWHRSTGSWAMPATVDTCLDLRAEFGEHLVVTPVLSDWYRQASVEQAQQATRADLSDATLSQAPALAPALAATLRPDQRVGAAWCAAGYRGGGLVADMPGLGKTLETIAGVLEADARGPILVVCPRLSVKPVWMKELSYWTDEVVYAARGTRAAREKAIAAFHADPAERKWLIIVADMLAVKRAAVEAGKPKADGKRRGRVEDYSYPELFDGDALGGGWSWVIVDESHRLLGSLTVAKSNLKGEGLTLLPLRPVAQKRALSGTPFGKGGRVQGMFGTLHWMWPDEYTSFWRWAERYFEVEEDEVYIKGGRGRTRTTKRVGKLRRGMDGEAFMKSLGPRILRRTKADVLHNLPPKQYREVLCEMTGAQLRQYKQLDVDAEVVVQNGVLMANGVLAERTRAKQIANGVVDVDDEGHVRFTGESCKVEMLEEMLETRGILDGQPGPKLIIASRFNEFLSGAVQPMLDKHGVSYFLLKGSTTDNERDRAMSLFQDPANPTRVFVINSMAGGISITLDQADEVHILDELDNPEDNEQLEDRAHRASREHQVTIFYYRSEGTIDTNIGEAVEGKRQEQHAVLDGRRGKEYTRSIVRYNPKGEA